MDAFVQESSQKSCDTRWNDKKKSNEKAMKKRETMEEKKIHSLGTSVEAIRPLVPAR
jgi:hypothetical protein